MGAQAEQSYNAGWSSYIGGDYDVDGVFAVAADSHTNVFLGGFLGQGKIQNGDALPPLTPYQGARDGFVAKLSAGGALAWYVCLGEAGNDCVLGMAAHTNGTVYAAGISDRYDDLGDYSGCDAFLASVAGASGSVNWTVALEQASGSNSFNAVAVDSNGYIYAVGYTTATDLSNPVSGYSVNGTTYGHAFKGATDAVVMKFAPANGSVVWSCYLGGVNDDAATAIAVTPDGSVYVGGETRSPGWASLSSRTPGPSNPDAFLVKLTTAGAHVWSALLGGSAADAVTSLAKAPASAVLFLGGSTASSDFLSGATRLNTYSGGTDGFVAQLTDTGTSFQTNWCRFLGGSTYDQVAALTPQALGSVVAGGTTASGAWLTQAGGSSFSGVQDGFLSQLNSDGSVAWSTYLGGAQREQLHALSSVSATLLAGGETLSPAWVDGGLWTEWNKQVDAGAGDFGFIAKWSTEPGVPPALADQPDDVTVPEGEAATFSVAATGSSPLTYRWLRNGVPVTGLASNTYVTAATVAGNNNDTYACLVSNLFGTVTSRAATLTVTAKGTLTVTLSPAAAVAQGAQWRLGGDPAWFASGSGTNLAPGTYAVSFADLAGWRAPGALTNLHLAAGALLATSGVYTAVLPAAARTISGTNVSVIVQAPAGLSAWSLVETLPAGLTPTNILGGGVWNAAAHTLTFAGSEAYTGTVSYLVICSASGVYTVSGTVTALASGQSVAVTGDSQIIKANFIRKITGTNVVITVTQPSAGVWWYVHEFLPAGLTASNITGPLFDYSEGELYWFKKSVGTNLSFTVSGEPGTYLFTTDSYGQIGASVESLFGDSVLIIPGAQPPDIPPPTILSFTPVAGSNAFYLTFTSVVSQAYMILTNATLHATNAWADYLSVPGQNGTTMQTVPMGGSNLFYRVRVSQ